jgi:hypothetical protein
MHLSHYLLKILSGLKAFVVNMDAVMNLEDRHDLSKSIDEIDEIVEMLGCFLGKNNSEEIFLCVNQAQVFTFEGIFGVRLNVLKMGLTSSLDLNFMRDFVEEIIAVASQGLECARLALLQCAGFSDLLGRGQGILNVLHCNFVV